MVEPSVPAYKVSLAAQYVAVLMNANKIPSVAAIRFVNRTNAWPHVHYVMKIQHVNQLIIIVQSVNA